MKRKLVISLIAIFIICCAVSKNKSSQKENQISSCFLGDQIIARKGYFANLSTTNKGYSVLNKQNELYQKNYSDFKNNIITQFKVKNVKLKIEKQFLKSKRKYRIVLYTFNGNKKKDSIEFYRNVDDLKYEPSNYTCLSYLDVKDKKIWQIKYFSSSVNNSVGYVLYKRDKIMDNGKIEADSLYYLDESLDVEMEKNKLYY